MYKLKTVLSPYYIIHTTNYNSKSFIYGKRTNKGQALITLLFFVIIALTVISAGVVILITNSFAATTLEQGTDAYYAAESGIENALLRFIRDQSYTGETLQIGTATITITVTPGTPITILSVAQDGKSIRKIQAQATYTNNVLTISSWKEVY